MKNSIKCFTTIILLISTLIAEAQTLVSGGIYSNTTWTKANSPYLADTVVVFPNVTLTIEPGVVVTVRGNLEIRQATLIAEGTATDSITFIGILPIRSDGDTLPSRVINYYNALSSKMNYCIIKDNALGNYISYGIYARLNSTTDSLIIKNSYFTNNGTALMGLFSTISIDSCLFENNLIAVHQSALTITNSILRKNQNALLFAKGAIIRNCIIDSNTYIGIEASGFDTITNCQIRNNGTGIECSSAIGYGSQIHNNTIENNNIGVQLSSPDLEFSSDSIYCNKICNNTTYNVKATTSYNRIVANNYWCTNDSLTIANSIYDGYDNTSLGLVNFMPIDTIQCYSITGIPNYEIPSLSFHVFPNPASDYLMIELPANNSKTDIKIFNLLGEVAYSSTLISRKTAIDISTMTNGMYIIQITTGNNIAQQKFIKEKNIR